MHFGGEGGHAGEGAQGAGDLDEAVLRGVGAGSGGQREAGASGFAIGVEMRGGGVAVASQKVENDEAAEDGGAFGGLGAGGRGRVWCKWRARTGRDDGPEIRRRRAERRVIGGSLCGFFQTLQRLQGVAFALQLPDFAGGILRGNPHSGKAKVNHNPREPHRYSLLHPEPADVSRKAYGFLLYH